MYTDQDDIGAVKLHKVYGYCSDYYNQRAREKARVAFFKCFVPYKKKYARTELEYILTMAVTNNKSKWDKCGPDLYMEADLEYFLELCKFEMGLTYDKNYVYLNKCKPWKNIFNYEIINENPKTMLKRIYEANCLQEWKHLDDVHFVDMIITLIEDKNNGSTITRKMIYRSSEYIENGIMLAELFDSKSVSSELKEYYARVKNLKDKVIETIRQKLYEFIKIFEFDYLMNEHYREGYLKKKIDSYVKLYKLITLKKIYY